ncbi:glutamate-5-semialdehyde dehydrogenase, partial [Oscillibacter sp. UBA6647]|uniref:glutamate-5-semialdehyde dehydrogenase n=1 Tax=Oscillibacter sp. UBA6647 TaxID=1947021 RepID=UPI0025F1158A
METMTALERQGQLARTAGRVLAITNTAQKNAALEAIAELLTKKQDLWLAANAEDVSAAAAAGMRPAMLDRLTLTKDRIAGIVEGIRQVATLPDPIGTVTKMETRPNGLIIGRRRVPLGVIAIIYEARPNVTADAAALCLKSGNACILRGGKEAIRSNRAAVELMRTALESAGLPVDCISLVQDTSRDTANELMHLTGYVDVLIPRGGADLIRAVSKNASVPVIRTGEGVCHVYIDSEADLDMGAKILFNAKCSRPSVCNAAECVLVAEDVAKDFFEKAVPLLKEKDVELRCDEAA